MTIHEIKTSERGFEFIEFTDRYDKKCVLQQSSLAVFQQPGSSAVWLGVAGSDHMHLDVNNVEWLIRMLRHWLEHGQFAKPVDATNPGT